jgi:chloramphenicol 3-O phosphotransferase
MLPRRYLRPPLWDEVLGRATAAGDVGQRLANAMHHAIAALARAGSNVVADHVLVERAWVDECAYLFADLPAYLIGVFCPLELLEQREKTRRNRTWGQARAQYAIVHTHTLYDLEVDTGMDSAEACAQQIMARLADDTPPVAWQQLRDRVGR